MLQSLVKSFDSRRSESQGSCPPTIPLQQVEPAEPRPGRKSREYFRIDTELSVSYWAIDDPRQAVVECSGRVNLSAGGLRLPHMVPLKLRQEVFLALTLPGEKPALIECLAKVVRFCVSGKGRREVAFEYSQIAVRDRDRIISFCLAEQRRALRKKVRVDEDEADSPKRG